MVAESSIKRRSSVSSSVVTTFIVFDTFYTALCLAFCVSDVLDKASHHEPVYFTRPCALHPVYLTSWTKLAIMSQSILHSLVSSILCIWRRGQSWLSWASLFYTALCLASCVFDVVDKAGHHEPVYFTRPCVWHSVYLTSWTKLAIMSQSILHGLVSGILCIWRRGQS